MASHFRWYPAESEIVVPFNARYSFPSQANKAVKMTPRIPPKNAGTFNPGNVIRLEFPAQGYVNPGKTTLEFDVEIAHDMTDNDLSCIRFQNNIQSIFSRVRLLYGATPIEDIPYYNVIIRQLTEWTITKNNQTSISEGIGGITLSHGQSYEQAAAVSSSGGSGIAAGAAIQVYNYRQKYVHGIDFQAPGTVGATGTTSFADVAGHGKVPNAQGNTSALDIITGLTGLIHPSVTKGRPKRRYQVQLMLGVFQQEKLIPTKFMASQLAIEITLENASSCMYYVPSVTQTTQPGTATTYGTPLTTNPSYVVDNVNLIPEILEFDASYDETFLRGLQTGGVPIKFSTWNNYRFSQNGVSSLNLQIQERSRSVKAIFCMQRRDPATFDSDSGAAFFNTALALADGAATLQEYQFRIGGRYFPAQPVQCALSVGGTVPNSGCEAYVELAKALNTLGDSRLTSSLDTIAWNTNPGSTDSTRGSTHSILPEHDFDFDVVCYKSSGSPCLSRQKSAFSNVGAGFGVCGFLPSSCFAMAIDLETSNGLEISGLNAEEQSDISLIARYSSPQAAGFVFDVFTYIDSMIVLRENNVLELIQ